MNLGYTRPVGEYLPIRVAPSSSFSWPEGYLITWCDSGTTALGLALRAAAIARQNPSPTALMPACSCPDLISAAVWAGVRPVLIDTRAGTPWLDEAAVGDSLDDSVVAVVAPHFLGIAHPLSALREICSRAAVLLVEDSAQLGPTSSAFQPSGDLVVLSFGRGKPVPAGGGALLYQERFADLAGQLSASLLERRLTSVQWTVRAAMQNLVMSRMGFAVVRRAPWLHVGETRYKRLDDPRRLGQDAARRIETVLSHWGRGVQTAALEIHSMLCRIGAPHTASALGWDGESPLLRYPLLAPRGIVRDEICDLLHGENIGATAFYGKVLPELPGVPVADDSDGLPCARDFAVRLLTLPCHSGLGRSELRRIEIALKSVRWDE